MHRILAGWSKTCTHGVTPVEQCPRARPLTQRDLRDGLNCRLDRLLERWLLYVSLFFRKIGLARSHSKPTGSLLANRRSVSFMEVVTGMWGEGVFQGTSTFGTDPRCRHQKLSKWASCLRLALATKEDSPKPSAPLLVDSVGTCA